MTAIHRYKRRGLAGLLVAMAMFAVASIGATSALAAKPEFKLKTGPFPVKFTSTGGQGKLDSAAGEVVCKSNTDSGEIANAKEAKKVKVLFKECEEPKLKVACHNKGINEIETEVLKGLLAYTLPKEENATKTARKAGIALSPEGRTPLAKFECSFITVEVTGSVIGTFEFENVRKEQQYNVFRKNAELRFVAKAGKQVPEEYETETGAKEKDTLSAFGGAATEETTDELENYVDVATGAAEEVELVG